ncbi:MAG TPA: NAD(P)H-dependent glycerol-3-phosphate dehydrogenase [Bryobacteraceae bacterium]|nr:NAD(P)H-dependent glycerol-3-phosphate dehydrogenase [Bryobacteraceae bacterium]
MNRLAVIGAGSWGTALSIVLAPRFRQVSLWPHELEHARQMLRTRENAKYLPGFALPPNIAISHDSVEVLQDADVVLGVTPSRFLREVFQGLLPGLRQSMVFVSATKGLEEGTLLRMSQVMREVIQTRFEPRIAILSGPTFAREVAGGEPAAVVIASEDRAAAVGVQQAFSGRTFRLYTNSDTIGVEVGAALKNVIAIGAGICQGLGLGNNTIAALITRGLAEISRLAVAMGGEPKTLAGLAGLGDLVLTCHGELSRNRRVGMELARGRSLDEILQSTAMVAEGVQTISAAVDLSCKYQVEMPITQQMYEILRRGKSPADGIRNLMERSLKEE